jgi:hypothetical protein
MNASTIFVIRFLLSRGGRGFASMGAYRRNFRHMKVAHQSETFDYWPPPPENPRGTRAISYDNENRHRNNGVCANNEVFGRAVPPKTFFFFTARLKDMTEKQTKEGSKSAKPAKVASRTKTAPAVSKAATPRPRTRSIAKAVSENEVQQKAYSLWESRGRPIGSPEIDWYGAKEQLSPEK